MKSKGISITGEAMFEFDIDMMVDKGYKTKNFEEL